MNATHVIKLRPNELSFVDAKFYLWTFAFILGNLFVPQACHLAMAKGGLIFLPIYFFTLIAGYKFGWRVGLVTAICSPLLNSALFGMPEVAMLPPILVKSVVLGLSAAFVAKHAKAVSLWHLCIVVLAYQSIGFVFEWFLYADLQTAVAEVKIGWIGMLLQVFLGYFVLRGMEKFMSEKV